MAGKPKDSMRELKMDEEILKLFAGTLKAFHILDYWRTATLGHGLDSVGSRLDLVNLLTLNNLLLIKKQIANNIKINIPITSAGETVDPLTSAGTKRLGASVFKKTAGTVNDLRTTETYPTGSLEFEQAIDDILNEKTVPCVTRFQEIMGMFGERRKIVEERVQAYYIGRLGATKIKKKSTAHVVVKIGNVSTYVDFGVIADTIRLAREAIYSAANIHDEESKDMTSLHPGVIARKMRIFKSPEFKEIHPKALGMLKGFKGGLSTEDLESEFEQIKILLVQKAEENAKKKTFDI